MLVWEKFGFTSDPFCPNKPNPDFFLYDSLCIEVTEIIKKGSGGEIICIRGDHGMGKTTFLMWLLFFLEENKIKTVFLPGALVGIVDPEEKIEKMIAGLRKPRLAILVDDADEISPDLQKKIFSFVSLPKGSVSIVFTSTKPPEEIEYFKEHRDIYVHTFELKKPPKDVIARMIEKRIAAAGGRGIEPFTAEELSTVIDKSKTIREILVSLEKMLERKVRAPLER